MIHKNLSRRFRARKEKARLVGKVVGSLFSTRKSEKLVGNKFMVVEPVEKKRLYLLELYLECIVDMLKEKDGRLKY